MSVLITLFWGISAGYVTAGLVSSIYQLVADRPVSFNMLLASPVSSALAVPLLVISGPAVLARNATRGRIVEGRPWGWIIASLFLVGCWSFFTGVIVIQILFALSGR